MDGGVISSRARFEIPFINYIDPNIYDDSVKVAFLTKIIISMFAMLIGRTGTLHECFSF